MEAIAYAGHIGLCRPEITRGGEHIRCVILPCNSESNKTPNLADGLASVAAKH